MSSNGLQSSDKAGATFAAALGRDMLRLPGEQKLWRRTEADKGGGGDWIMAPHIVGGDMNANKSSRDGLYFHLTQR